MDLTCEDLRRKIAELEGWTDVHEFPGGPLVGIEPTGLVSRAVPDWLTDANAAMELVGKMSSDDAVAYVNIIAQHGGSFTAGIGFSTDSEDIDVHGDSFCESVCRLYVAWREAKEGKQ